MAKIVAGPCDTYDVPSLQEFFVRSLAELHFSFDGCKVLFKPNLLSGKAPGKAVNTHPLFVRALAEVFLDRKCTIFVGDSPGYESTEKALQKSGIMDVVRELKLGVAAFDKRLPKASAGISPYREFIFGEDPLDYDIVVNLPKLKSHILMGLTAGVKNTFGFIPYLDKAKWHLRCGADKRLFAALLIDIHSVVRPALTVLDGIVAMDGGGPSHGRVRDLGLVALSDDALTLDAFLEKFLSIPHSLPITSVALERGLLKEPTVIDAGAPVIRDFLMPKVVETDWNLPSLVRDTARRVFTKKPRCDARQCTTCRTCVTVCPAEALTISDDSKVVFDYGRCIRCYCCAEMCPSGAITV
jgi:uncharacterized protein (DUF362 family)/NAD-dependent dihydropyrimidine dehydrogenase PreA subunit